MSPDNRNNPSTPQPQQQSQVVAAYEEHHSGPLPAPQVLQKYNEIIPGAAERILAMAEKQSDHRMDLERNVIYSGVRKSYLGMFFAMCIAIYALYVAKEMAIQGNPKTAGLIAALDIVGLISVALYNGAIQKNERSQRRDSSSRPPGRS